MHHTTQTSTSPSWRDHTDSDAREAAILTDLTLDTELAANLAEPPF